MKTRITAFLVLIALLVSMFGFYGCVENEEPKEICKHQFGEWQHSEPNCITPGADIKICRNCGEKLIKNLVDPLGHEYASDFTYNNISHWFACVRCGDPFEIENHDEDENGICVECGINGKKYLDDAYIYDGSEVTITFYHTMSVYTLQPVLNEAIKAFNVLYPNIHVEHKQVGGYDDVFDQIRNELTAGNPPNIACCQPDHVALYNRAGATMPLDGLIASTATITDAKGNKTTYGLTAEQIADFIPGFYREGAIYDTRGTMYTLPLSKSTEALYYNKTFFEENNLKVPTTWDEMEEVCRAIKKIDPTCIPLGYDSESNWFITMCEQYGSGYTTLDKNDPFKFDNTQNRAFIERFAGWYKEGLVTTQELYGAYTSELFTEIATDKQKCYMLIGSTGGASYNRSPMDAKGNYVFEAGVTSIPQIDPANPKVITQGPSLVIFEDSKINSITKQEVAASWLFIKYLTTDVEFQTFFSMASGYAPVIKSAQNNEIYKADFLDRADGYANLAATSVKFALSQHEAHFASPAFEGSSVARLQVGLIIQNVFEKVLNGEGATKDIIDAEFKRALGECNYAIGK